MAVFDSYIILFCCCKCYQPLSNVSHFMKSSEGQKRKEQHVCYPIRQPLPISWKQLGGGAGDP